MNLILAAMWLALAVLLFALHALDPEAPHARLGLPLFWIAMALCVYNVLRGLAVRSQASRDEAPWRRHRDRPRPEPRERDPDFIFDDPPPSTGIEGRSAGEGPGGK